MNRYTVITGASSGIGRAAAELFAKRGRNLILTARREDRLEKMQSEFRREYPETDTLIYKADLSVKEQAYQFYNFTKSYCVETWINNAGRGYIKKADQQDVDTVLEMIRLNVDAVTILSLLYIGDYKDLEGSTLINVSSVAGYTLYKVNNAYSASKFYVGAFTEGLAKELNGDGHPIRVKVLAPSGVMTEFASVATGRIVTEEMQKASGRKTMTADEMAGCLWTLYKSDKITGIVEKDHSFRMYDGVFSYIG